MIVKHTKQQINRDYKFSVYDGIFWILMSSIASTFLVPFILALGANSFQVGLLGAFPLFVSSFFVLISYRVQKLFSSKKQAVVIFVILQAIMWIPLAIIHFFVSKEVTIWMIIFIYLIITASGMIVSPIYKDWIKKIFIQTRMGDYLARKNLITSIISIIPIILAGYILDIIKASDTLIGFTIIFILAGLFRLFSGFNLNRMSRTETKEEILKESKERSKIPIFKIFKKEVLNDKNFLRYMIFVMVFYFSVYIGTLYLPYFLLHTLKYTYIKYTWWAVAYILGNILSLRYWGYFSDKFGSVNVLKNTVVFVPLFVLIPAVFYRYYFILLILNFFGGVVFSGLNLSIVNYFYQYVKKDLINHYSFFLIIQSTALFLGTMFGSLVIKLATKYFGVELFAIITVFLVSAVFRFISIFFVRNLKDIKRKDISLWKDVVLQKPVFFGLHEFGYYFFYEEKKVLYSVDKDEKKFIEFVKKKEDPKVDKKIKTDEKILNKEIKKIIKEEKELIEKFEKK